MEGDDPPQMTGAAIDVSNHVRSAVAVGPGRRDLDDSSTIGIGRQERVGVGDRQGRRDLDRIGGIRGPRAVFDEEHGYRQRRCRESSQGAESPRQSREAKTRKQCSEERRKKQDSHRPSNCRERREDLSGQRESRRSVRADLQDWPEGQDEAGERQKEEDEPGSSGLLFRPALQETDEHEKTCRHARERGRPGVPSRKGPVRPKGQPRGHLDDRQRLHREPQDGLLRMPIPVLAPETQIGQGDRKKQTRADKGDSREPGGRLRAERRAGERPADDRVERQDEQEKEPDIDAREDGHQEKSGEPQGGPEGRPREEPVEEIEGEGAVADSHRLDVNHVIQMERDEGEDESGDHGAAAFDSETARQKGGAQA